MMSPRDHQKVLDIETALLVLGLEAFFLSVLWFFYFFFFYFFSLITQFSWK